MRNIIPPEERSRVRLILTIMVFGALLVAALIYLNNIFKGLRTLFAVITPFLIGIALAFIQYPIVKRIDQLFSRLFSRRKPHPRLWRGLASAVSLLLLLGIVALFCIILLPQLYGSLRQLLNTVNRFLQENAETVNTFLAEHEIDFINLDGSQFQISWDEVMNQVSTYGNTLLTQFFSVVTTVTGKLYQMLYPVFMGLIAAFYFLMEKEHICAMGRKTSYALFQRETSESLIFWTRRGSRIFSGFITGKLLDSLIIGLLCYLFMLIFRYEYSLLISVIIGITNILPFFGPIIGAVPSVLILLIVNPSHALGFTILVLLLQQLDGNVIGPLILKDYVDISAMWILISLIIGGGLFGFLGMLLSVPTFALVYAIVRTALDRRLIRKGLPTSTAYYESNDPEE